jgi:hypothetical protein
VRHSISRLAKAHRLHSFLFEVFFRTPVMLVDARMTMKGRSFVTHNRICEPIVIQFVTKFHKPGGGACSDFLE